MQTQTRQATRPPLDMDVEDEDRYYVTKSHTATRRYDLPARRDTLESPIIRPGTVIQRRRSAMTPATSGGGTCKAMIPSFFQRGRFAPAFSPLTLPPAVARLPLSAIT